jgi:hypothetical protein
MVEGKGRGRYFKSQMLLGSTIEDEDSSPVANHFEHRERIQKLLSTPKFNQKHVATAYSLFGTISIRFVIHGGGQFRLCGRVD